MKTKPCLLILSVFFWVSTSAQGPINRFGKKLNAESFDVSVFTNQYYVPFMGIKNVFTAKYHPGLSLGYTRNLKQKKKRTTYLDARLGVYNHRFIQTGIQLYGTLGYRVMLPRTFFIAGEFSLGYLHAILHQTTFEADGNGNYSKVRNYGKAQLMTGIGIKIGKQIKIKEDKMRIYINYQPWFQLPFIKSYVPLLPNNSVHLGFNFILK